jgi:hypothetical protein
VAIAGPSPRLLWETAGFVAPESVVFDRERQQLYVSNMGTWGEGATPGDGFISRVRHIAPEGKTTLLMKLPRGAADHHYLADRRLLVIPLLLDNAIRAYRWAPSNGD